MRSASRSVQPPADATECDKPKQSSPGRCLPQTQPGTYPGEPAKQEQTDQSCAQCASIRGPAEDPGCERQGCQPDHLDDEDPGHQSRPRLVNEHRVVGRVSACLDGVNRLVQPQPGLRRVARLLPGLLDAPKQACAEIFEVKRLDTLEDANGWVIVDCKALVGLAVVPANTKELWVERRLVDELIP